MVAFGVVPTAGAGSKRAYTRRGYNDVTLYQPASFGNVYNTSLCTTSVLVDLHTYFSARGSCVHVRASYHTSPTAVRELAALHVIGAAPRLVMNAA